MRAAGSDSTDVLVQLHMPLQPADCMSGTVRPKQQQQPASSPAARLAHSAGCGSKGVGHKARAAGRPAGAPGQGGRARGKSVPLEQQNQYVAAAAGMRQRFSAALSSVLDEDLGERCCQLKVTGCAGAVSCVGVALRCIAHSSLREGDVSPMGHMHRACG